MASISMVAYVLSVKDKVSDDRYLLNDLHGENILNIFKEFIGENKSTYANNKDLERIYLFEENKEGQESDKLYKFITGKIKTGSYGLEAEIINSETGILKTRKDDTDAEVMPFHFILALPNGDVDKCVLILQRNGIYSIKSLIENELGHKLKLIDPNYKLSIGSIAPTAYIERILTEGILQKVRFIRFNLPQDSSNQVGLKNNGVTESYDEYVINKPIGFLKNNKDKILKVVKGQSNINNIVEVRHFDYDNMKLDIKLGKKVKSINLGDTTSISFNEDITNQVTLIGGLPTTKSIIPLLIESADIYLLEMGLIVRE